MGLYNRVIAEGQQSHHGLRGKADELRSRPQPEGTEALPSEHEQTAEREDEKKKPSMTS
jgi:hypothetical protein